MVVRAPVPTSGAARKQLLPKAIRALVPTCSGQAADPRPALTQAAVGHRLPTAVPGLHPTRLVGERRRPTAARGLGPTLAERSPSEAAQLVPTRLPQPAGSAAPRA